MKQTITPEQLNELSDKGKTKLRKWWKPKEGDWVVFKKFSNLYLITEWWGDVDDKGLNKVYEPAEGFLYDWDSNNFPRPMHKSKLTPLLSIGQMIEFLGEGWHLDNAEKLWHVCKESDIKKYPECNFMQEKKELSDALWQACKEVLNEV